MALLRYGIETDSVFELLGKDENSATFALGWVIDRSPVFRSSLLSDVLERPPEASVSAQIHLQRHTEHGGFTDIEIEVEAGPHLIVEAKQGWTIPTHEQLQTYARRVTPASRSAARIMSVSAATREYAASRLPKECEGVRVTHRSWADIKHLAEAARRNSRSYEEKLWLRHLDEHLKDYVTMQNPRDNLVFVVALSVNPIKDGSDYTWIDVVEKDGRYFHPVGNHWPVVPPNYVGFRYHGQLQSVHHIDSHTVVDNLFDVNSNWPETSDDHFVYTLGPPMKPARQLRTGKIWPTGRVWCAIDTLLSGACDTVRDARDETSRRMAHEEVPSGEDT